MTHRCCMLWWWWRHIFDPCAWFLLCCWPMKLCAACTYNCKTRGWQVVLRCLLPLLLVLALIGVGMGVGIWELLDVEKRMQDRAPSPSPAPRLNTTAAPANTSVSAWSQKPVRVLAVCAGALLECMFCSTCLKLSAGPPKSSARIAVLERHFCAGTLPLLQVNKGAVAAVAVMGVVTSLFAMLVGGLKHCKDISDSIESGASYASFNDHRDKLGYQSQVRPHRVKAPHSCRGCQSLKRATMCRTLPLHVDCAICCAARVRPYTTCPCATLSDRLCHAELPHAVPCATRC